MHSAIFLLRNLVLREGMGAIFFEKKMIFDKLTFKVFLTLVNALVYFFSFLFNRYALSEPPFNRKGLQTYKNLQNCQYELK